MITSATRKVAAAVQDTALRQTAKQFEAIFLRQMIASMRGPGVGDDLFGSDASNQFRDMSDARLADSMAGRFGIAQLLEKQFVQ
jgi:peptidoglycan hydrolase FlgJ